MEQGLKTCILKFLWNVIFPSVCKSDTISYVFLYQMEQTFPRNCKTIPSTLALNLSNSHIQALHYMEVRTFSCVYINLVIQDNHIWIFT